LPFVVIPIALTFSLFLRIIKLLLLRRKVGHVEICEIIANRQVDSRHHLRAPVGLEDWWHNDWRNVRENDDRNSHRDSLGAAITTIFVVKSHIDVKLTG